MIVKWQGILLGLAMACGTINAWAAELHVAQKNPAADDGNAGTPDKPFMTINAALPKLWPGDVLFVHEGVYREGLFMHPSTFRSGKPGQPIRISTWPGETVVIKGSDVVTGWQPHANAVWVKEGWTNNSQQVFGDGKSLRQIAGDPGQGEHNKHWKGRKGEGLKDLEAGSFYVDLKEQKLYVWLADGSDPKGHEIEATVGRAGIRASDLNYIQIWGFKVTHAGVGIGGSVGSYNLLEDCEITYADICGLSVGGRCNTILRCKMNNNGNTGLSTFGWGHRVIDCETSFNNWQRWFWGWHAGGMKNFSSDTVIRGCVAEGNIESPGIWFDGGNANVTIANCRSFRNALGIMYEIGDRATIVNNICYENKGRGIYISNSAYCYIAYNVCYKNAMSGIVVSGVDRGGGLYGDEQTGYEQADHNVVWGNIMMDNCDPGLLQEMDLKGWELRPELIMPDPDIKSNSGNVSDYNLFWRSNGRGFPFWYNWGSKSYETLADWQDKTGLDRHSIVARPLFKDLATYDFNPADQSPAILLVKPRRSGAATDFENRQRLLTVMQTAGPFEADPKVLLPQKPPEAQAFATLGLTEARPFPTNEAAVSLAGQLRALVPVKLPDGKGGVPIRDVPFLWSDPPQAMVLNASHPSARIAVGRAAKRLNLAHAVLSPAGTGVVSRCRIHRQDGTTVDLIWEAGKNIGPSLGEWKGMPDGEPPQPGKTAIGWQSQAGTARIFLTTWDNDNEWYPIRELEWTLEDRGATVLILGVTAR